MAGALGITPRRENLLSTMPSPRHVQIHNARGIACVASFVRSSCHRSNLLVIPNPLLRKQWLPQRRDAPQPRRASTIAPVSVVNAVTDIPSPSRRLHEALEGLKKDAEAYTDLSQLQLALRGLESQNAITRIARWSTAKTVSESTD